MEIGRVVGEDQSAAQADRGGYDECIDSQLAAGADGRQEMAGDPGDPDPVVITGGVPLGTAGTTNTLKVQVAGERE